MTATTTSGLDPRVHERIVRCLAHATPRVIAAYLFGSAARHETTPLSDIDIAVYLDEPDRKARVRSYPALRHCLEQVVAAYGDAPVDLTLLNDAPSVLAGRAVAGELLYSADEPRRTAFEAAVQGQYQDLLSLHESYDRLLYARTLAGLFGERSGVMIDRRVVNDRLAYIQAMLQQLQGRRALSLETLKTDPDKRGATLYELQTCLEAMSDIANHLIAATGLRKPGSRTEAFAILAEAHILPADLARRLAQAAGPRNILTHGYLDVMLDLVYQTLQDDLPDVSAFARHVVIYLQSQPEPQQPL